MLICVGCDLLPTQITHVPGPSAIRTPIALPTLEMPGDDSGLALIEGVVRGDPSARCVWLEAPDGQELTLTWPPGYTAILDPLTVYDETGLTVISGRSSVELGGLNIAAYKLAPRPASCSHGNVVFAISNVVAVGSQPQ